MSDEDQIDIEDVTEQNENEPEQNENENEDDALEAEAREMGWVPLEEFRGPEDQWRDKAEFVNRGKSVLPIVNSLLKKERAKTTRLEAKIEKIASDYEQKFSRLNQMSQRALDQQKRQLESRFSELKEKAVELGDMDAYRSAEKAEREAMSDLVDSQGAPEGSAQAPNIDPDTKDWVSRVNFDRWPEYMKSFAIDLNTKLMSDQPTLSMAENLDMVMEAVQEKFPEKFGKSKPKAPKVAPGSRTGGGSSDSAYGRLPKDAKTMCNEQVELYLKPGETIEKDAAKAKERWAKVYWDQPGVE